VHLRYGRDHLDIEILDDGRGSGHPDGEEGGHGLAGMRERVGAYRGSLEAGPGPDGGYRLHALLPVRQ
jgi:signal transduction histidine kinase